MQVKTPIVDALHEYINKSTIRFHMPGHKGSPKSANAFTNLVGTSVFLADVTNVPGMDDLHQPYGIIKEAEQLAARAFGADQTYFLVNGSSCGLQALVMSVCKPGEKILIPRNIHRSILGGIILSGAAPVYYLPEFYPDFGIPLGADPEEIRACLSQDNSIKAVLVINPTYQGIVSDLVSIAGIVHSFGLPLLVDEAHGSHFKFSSQLPPSSLELGADGVVHGTHKLMTSLTQSSMLHLKGDRIDRQRLEANLRILQSTSTSYLLLSSLDASRAHLEQAGEQFIESALTYSSKIREGVRQIPKLKTFGREIIGQTGVYDIDTTKVTISFRSLGVSGLWVERMLRSSFDIQVEMADLYNVLLLVTFGNTYVDVEAVLSALQKICNHVRFRHPLEKGYGKVNDINIFPDLPEAVVTPREAFLAPTTAVPFEESAGRISAEIIACYPPGIPLVSPGERVTEEIIDYLLLMRDIGAHFQGCYDNSLEYIRVLK